MWTPPFRIVTPLAALALFAAAALPPAHSADGGEVVVGMSAAFSGPSRGLGIELYRGAMAYFEDVNRRGGVHGRALRLVARDDGYNPSAAVANTLRLVREDRALLLFGYVGTPTVARVLPLLKQFELEDEDQPVLLYFPFTGAESLRRGLYEDFVFIYRASYWQETEGLVERFVAVARRKIAVFYQVDAYGRNGWDGVRRALEKRGLELGADAEATYTRGTGFGAAGAFRPHVDILRRGEPDAVIAVGAYGACAGFIRDARDAGWDVPIANVSFVGSENMLRLLQDAGKAAGKDYTRHLINSQVVPNYQETDLPAVQEYHKLMRRFDPTPPPGVDAAGYEAQDFCYVSFEGFLDAKLLGEILERAGPDPDRRRVRDAAESGKPFQLGAGTDVRFSRRKHQGQGAVYFTTVRDGRFVTLADADWQKEWGR